jgi:ABC-type proline/glycine betaine transport system permease subunit
MLLRRKHLFLFFTSVGYGVFSASYCQAFSRDYTNIMNSILFTNENFVPSGLLLLYHLKGNTLLLFLFNVLKVTPSIAVFTLFLLAAALRFWFSFRYLRFWDAFFVMFAFYWMLDWNQSRFSIVFFISYLALQRAIIFLPIFHFMVFIKVFLDRFKAKWIIIASFGSVLFTVSGGPYFINFWSRYFQGTEDTFPLYFFAYLFFFIVLVLFQGKSYSLRHLSFFTALSFVFFYFIENGMSPVYFGRLVEVFLLKASYDFFLSSKNFNLKLLTARLFMFLIGFYQSLTVAGNVWRFIS